MALLNGRVYRLQCCGVNAYLVDGGDLTLVDAGTPLDAERVREGVAAAGHAVDALDRALVTHNDLDHVEALPALDVPVVAAEPDASYLTGVSVPRRWDRKGALQRLAGVLVSAPAGPVRPVRDGDHVEGFTADHAPGHTPGHTVYVREALGVAFLGDLVCSTGDGLAPPSRWRTGDVAENEASIRELGARLPAFEVAAPGHGEPLAEGGDAALSAAAGYP